MFLKYFIVISVGTVVNILYFLLVCSQSTLEHSLWRLITTFVCIVFEYFRHLLTHLMQCRRPKITNPVCIRMHMFIFSNAQDALIFQLSLNLFDGPRLHQFSTNL